MRPNFQVRRIGRNLADDGMIRIDFQDGFEIRRILACGFEYTLQISNPPNKLDYQQYCFC